MWLLLDSIPGSTEKNSKHNVNFILSSFYSFAHKEGLSISFTRLEYRRCM